jgi:hypothetical protein
MEYSMQQEIIIHGASKSKGETESGYKYDFGKIFVLAPFDASNENKVGFAGIEMRTTSSCFANLKTATFPVTCNIEIGLEASGKGEFKQVVTSITPKASSART